jgi:hypothetical protein
VKTLALMTFLFDASLERPRSGRSLEFGHFNQKMFLIFWLDMVSFL